MAKAYTTSTASYDLPVILSFTCPKCGQSSAVNKKAVLSAQYTVRGYNSAAANQIARQNLVATADKQVNTLLETLKKGQINVLLPADNKPANKGVVCPHCHLKQVVVADGKPKALYTGGFFGAVAALAYAILFVPVIFLSLASSKYGRSIPVPVPILLTLACVGALVWVVLRNRQLSRKAHSDPALMEKRYRSVLNPQVQASLMAGVGNIITVNVPETPFIAEQTGGKT